jgi:hypothetical protein
MLPRLRVGLLVPVACGHRWRLLVTRTVREGASVHGPASYSTLDMIGNYDRANGMVDGDLCNGALLRCFLAYASGYWPDGRRPSVASASNPHREGGGVSTRPSVLFHSRHDRQLRSCERFGRRWLMPLSVALVLPRLRVGLLACWPAAIGGICW